MSEDERRIPRRSVLGQGTAVTFSVMSGLLALAFWTGVLWTRLNDVTEKVPAVADAAKAYTDGQVGQLNVKLDDIIVRLDRVERQIDHTGR